MDFTIKILGSNAALPALNTIASAQLVTVGHHSYLIDCAEGTQMKMMQYNIRRNKIKAIFISHLHGDHLFGLPGLLTSYAHFQRVDGLTIIGPLGIAEFVETTIRLSVSHLLFDIVVKEISSIDNPVYEDNVVEVRAVPLHHRIPTFGYVISEKPRLNIRQNFISEYHLSYDEIRQLKQGNPVQRPSHLIYPEDALFTKHAIRRYAYCSDTAYDEAIIPYINNANALYHESTYLSDMQELAAERMHSTTSDAANIARKADVDLLLLGHYSTRYADKTEFLRQAKQIFPNTMLTQEGTEVVLKEKD
ncbi:MAG: ribonuclease Z [Saprospiraceae bacterium]|nr:MAG: ribonuclease Z [Bacteroidetes bacterium OLB9]MCO6464413.1 ribonuclease Z [Saprospiraceae bacterium]MCZ2340060.1 ribonuclease Z [Chitinophagales bacterium]